MQPIQTGIAVALALGVVVFFFIFGGFSFFAVPGDAGATPNEVVINQDSTLPTSSMPTPTNLEATDEVVGTGATAETGNTVTVNYVGALTNGTVFDASANRQNPDGTYGFTFVLGAGRVIQGWDQGIVGMKEGGKRKLLIPAALAYGSQDYGPIPANSTLIFEVELVKVQKTQ